MLDKKVFFQRQIEECRELERHAVNDQDRAFWQQIADRWEAQLRLIKPKAPGPVSKTQEAVSEKRPTAGAAFSQIQAAG